MVYSPAPIPFSKGNAKLRVFLHNSLPSPVEPLCDDSRTDLVFDSIRSQIESGARIEEIYEAAAAAAQDLTSASGAAIALGQDSAVVCVGRSGHTAPELGAQVSVDTGISGECMRSGKTLTCDDTQIDSRVDASVCSRLGLRSLVAVPLSGAGNLVGLVEVFSNYPSNFSQEHVFILKGLAEMVELAHSRMAAEAAAAKIEPEPAVEGVVAVDEALAEPRTIDWLRDSQQQARERKFPYWTIPVVLILIMVSFRGWMTWHRPPTAPIAVVPQPVAQEETLTLNVSPKPSATRSVNRRQAPPRESAAEPNAEEVVVRRFDGESGSRQAVDMSQVRGEDAAPPQLPVLNAENAGLENLVTRQANMPQAAPRVSQGVVRGAVLHRVPPAYPAEALAMGLSGAVVLRATVDEKGSVVNVKTIDGAPALARAASDAVKQWRYQPSLLNGTPVRVEAEITVNFKKP